MNPICLWAKSKSGIHAPFLYCGGYFLIMTSALFKFSAENSNGMSALFSLVSLWTEMILLDLVNVLDCDVINLLVLCLTAAANIVDGIDYVIDTFRNLHNNGKKIEVK